MEFLRWLFDAQIHVGDQSLLVREVLGNAFGLASALGGMRRKVWAWPVGILGNLLLQVADGALSLNELLKADPDVTAVLSPEAIDAEFDLGYHHKHVDTIFTRVFGNA